MRSFIPIGVAVLAWLAKSAATLETQLPDLTQLPTQVWQLTLDMSKLLTKIDTLTSQVDRLTSQLTPSGAVSGLFTKVLATSKLFADMMPLVSILALLGSVVVASVKGVEFLRRLFQPMTNFFGKEVKEKQDQVFQTLAELTHKVQAALESHSPDSLAAQTQDLLRTFLETSRTELQTLFHERHTALQTFVQQHLDGLRLQFAEMNTHLSKIRDNYAALYSLLEDLLMPNASHDDTESQDDIDSQDDEDSAQALQPISEETTPYTTDSEQPQAPAAPQTPALPTSTGRGRGTARMTLEPIDEGSEEALSDTEETSLAHEHTLDRSSRQSSTTTDLLDSRHDSPLAEVPELSPRARRQALPKRGRRAFPRLGPGGPTIPSAKEPTWADFFPSENDLGLYLLVLSGMSFVRWRLVPVLQKRLTKTFLRFLLWVAQWLGFFWLSLALLYLLRWWVQQGGPRPFE